jgi:hypothetical protein
VTAVTAVTAKMTSGNSTDSIQKNSSRGECI